MRYTYTCYVWSCWSNATLTCGRSKHSAAVLLVERSTIKACRAVCSWGGEQSWRRKMAKDEVRSLGALISPLYHIWVYMYMFCPKSSLRGEVLVTALNPKLIFFVKSACWLWPVRDKCWWWPIHFYYRGCWRIKNWQPMFHRLYSSYFLHWWDNLTQKYRASWTNS